MPVIGFLHTASPDAFADRLRGFRQGLKDTGYVEGEDVAIEYRWAENQITKGCAPVDFLKILIVRAWQSFRRVASRQRLDLLELPPYKRAFADCNPYSWSKVCRVMALILRPTYPDSDEHWSVYSGDVSIGDLSDAFPPEHQWYWGLNGVTTDRSSSTATSTAPTKRRRHCARAGKRGWLRRSSSSSSRRRP